MKKHNNGFTLVELLAVIVILGILLLLAMPAVTSQIELSRKKAFTNDAQTIASAVKDDILMGDKALTSNNGFTYDMSQINNLLDKKLGKSPFGGNYKIASAKVDINNPTGRRSYTIRVCLIDDNGNGFGYNRYENLSTDTIVMGTADTTDNDCATFGINTAASVITKEIINSNNHNLKDQITEDNHEDFDNDNSQTSNTDNTEYRFVGDNTIVKNNYVYFNCSDTENQTRSTCDLYRIIGISNVDDGSGNIEQRVKLISVKTLKINDSDKVKWNESNSNDWTESSLQEYLNGTFYNSINPKYQELIGTARYYLGGAQLPKEDEDGFTPIDLYEYERKTANDADYKYFHSSHPDTTYWDGRIALMYASDYGYAAVSENVSCATTPLMHFDTGRCADNWLWNVNKNDEGDSLTPSWTLDQVTSRNDVFIIGNTGLDYTGGLANSSLSAYPVFYLSADAELFQDPSAPNEFGTYAHPYRLFK